jgi:hypothetical protein
MMGAGNRAQNIRAKLKVWSSAGTGTEVDLSVPGRIVFRHQRQTTFYDDSRKRFRLESERHKWTG